MIGWVQAVVGTLIGLLAAVGVVGVIGLVGMIPETRRKQQQRPEPVNAIAENVTWRHARRLEDRAKWDTDFWELEHGEPLPAWAHDSLVLGQVPPPTGPPREPPAWIWDGDERRRRAARRKS